MRIIFLKKICLSIFLLIVLSGCSLVSKKNEPYELTFQITWDKNSGRGDAISILVDDFNTSQKKVHVTMIGGSENNEDYTTALQEAKVDVFVVPYRYIQDNTINMEFVDLTIPFEKHWSNFYDTIVTLATTPEGIKAVPWIGHSMCLIFNRNLVKEAGVNPYEFRSLQDLYQGAKLIDDITSAKGIGLVGANHHDLTWMVSQFIYTYGGALVDFDQHGNYKSVVINSEASKKAIEFYIEQLGSVAQEGWEDDTGVEVMEAFANEEVALEIQGPWAISDIWKKGNPFEVGIVPLDQLGMYSEVGPLMLSVANSSPNKEAAYQFIEYLISKEALEKIMDGEYDPKYEAYYPFRVPLRKDMEDSEFFTKYPEFLAFIEGYKRPSVNTPCNEWLDIQEVRYPYYIHEAIIGNMTVEDALEEVGK